MGSPLEQVNAQLRVPVRAMTHARRLVRRFVQRARRRRGRPALALMYHRVAERDLDPWGLVVTPDHFAEQLEVIRSQWRPIALTELVEALSDDEVPEGAVVVTFDDGYRDSLSVAKPALERAGIPASVFVVSGYVGAEREFWWDELEQILLGPGDLPAKLTLRVGGVVEELEVGAAASSRRYVWEAEPRSRLALYHHVWGRLLPLADDVRRPVLDELAAWAGRDVQVRPTHRPVAAEDVRALAEGGLVSVGAHTVTHPYLPALHADAQRHELAASKRSLEELLDQPVKTFSYPFGATGEALARETGFKSAFTIEPRTVRPKADPFLLPRYPVRNWNGDEFARNLREWLGP